MNANRAFTMAGRAVAAFVLLLTAVSARGADVFEIPLENPSFDQGLDKRGVPLGWSRYGGGLDQKLEIVDGPNGGKALLIADGNPATELGVTQSVALQGGETYRVTVKVAAVEGDSPAGSHLQFRFLPSNRFVQKDLVAKSGGQFSEVSVTATAPPDTTKAVIYLYTHREPTPKVLVANVRLEGGVPPPPVPLPPPPPPIPPQYERLKNLYLDIALVQADKPAAAIVAPAYGVYASAAAIIQGEIAKRTGVKVPIVSPDSPQAIVPLSGNLIVLGNRSTNQTISALYDRYYCLVDLKYPGPGGYVLRSVHNPFGNGHGVLLVGASDADGVNEGAKLLAGILARTPSAKGHMSVGWTMETRLGRGIKPPTDIKDFETWEASKGYRSVGYFGWCSISKRMAMYYMTGDRHSAREVVRLAFPDRQALKEIEEIDGERIENKHDPLAGFYHYNAHMAILLWDLIEESPVFTDAERLKITNAFARQLNHRKGEGVYTLTRAPAHVGSRHGQWSAISLYCLGRYFNKDYRDAVWAQSERAGQLAFQSLHQHAWVSGENDNLFWYNTANAPILTYMVLTGDRKPLENGVLADLLRGQEILASGRTRDWALNSAAMDFLNKAAYLTGDGRWITYRQRTGVDTDVFRLGQSFWPDESIQPTQPVDLVGKWSIQRLPQPAWTARRSGIPFEQSFYFSSYRSAVDAGGDFVLLDGFNGASRNPYHTFDILQLRLAGRTILDGYHNQVVTSADGMVEPAVAMDAALLHSDVVGHAATAVGEVPRMAFCNWRRTLAQRTGRYALIADDIAFRTDSRNMKVATTWQVPGGAWDPKNQTVRLSAVGPDSVGRFHLRSCDVHDVPRGGVVTMNWHGAVKPDQHRIVFYLIAQAGTAGPNTLACLRLAGNAAVLALPQPALAVVGEYAQTRAEFAVVAQDHLYGHSLSKAGIDGLLVSSDAPLDLDWDFAAGTIQVVAKQATTLRLSLKSADTLRLDDAAVIARQAGKENEDSPHLCKAPSGPFRQMGTVPVFRIDLPAGRHVLSAAMPAAEAESGLKTAFARLLSEGQRLRAEAISAAASPSRPSAGEWPAAMIAQLREKVTDMIQVPAAEGTQLAIASGSAIHLLTSEGREVRTLQTDGPIRVLHWWDEPKLLLAGCVDEKVIAFDSSGGRAWVFTSEMDPAVYEAAKTYWFKSAPGHEGIHGLYTATFDEGKSRCFVGSACTLEILDEAGKLVKRTPVFWGPGRRFLLVNDQDGSRNLLVARWPNGNDSLAIVNSKTMAVTGRRYDGVPAGHAYVGGWTAQNRTGLVCEDLDGDGKREVATAINGTWNRVTVYSEDGKPLYNAQFGPGRGNTPRATMRDMDVADLDGDGKKEIVVGIAEGLIVVLNHECQPAWSARLPSPPVALRCLCPTGAKQARLVAGCEDGTVAALDAKGAVIRIGKIAGRPTHIVVIQSPAGPLAVLATEKGEIQGFKIGD